MKASYNPMFGQIEENTRVLEKLGQRFTSPSVERRGYASSQDGDADSRSGEKISALPENICTIKPILFSAGGQRAQGAGEVEAGRQEGAAAVGPGSGLPPARGRGEKRRKYQSKIFFV